MSKELTDSDREDADVTSESKQPQAPAATDGSEVSNKVEHADLRAHLIAAIRACLKNRDQQIVIIEMFLNDKTLKEVAEQLQTTPGNIYVLKGRALRALRQCEDFIRLYEEWLNEPPSHS